MSINEPNKRKAFGQFSTRPFTGLGSGKLSAFAGESDNKPLDGAIIVPISELVPNFFQVRQYFDEGALKELAEDIRIRGILEPLIVRSTPDRKYEIVAGERRYRAAQQAELTEVPVIIREMSDQEARFAMLAENLQRQDLDIRDEQRFLQTLQTDYNLSVRDLAQLINRSTGYVSQVIAGKYPARQQLDSTERSKIEALSDISQSQDEIVHSNAEVPSDTVHPDLDDKVSATKLQSTQLRYNPAVYKRVSQFFDNTLQILNSSPDKQTIEQIRESVVDAECKIAELKGLLEKTRSDGSI